jgi:N6-adenosine-specific RNA methylase IME4
MNARTIVTTKTCSRCGQSKSMDEFKSDSRKPGGKASSCKSCNTAVGYISSGPLSDLSLYDQALTLLAKAKIVDEVKAILDKSAALAEYARRAKDRTGIIDMTEIMFFAERRMGEMLISQKETVGLNTGTRGQIKGRSATGAVETEAPEDRRPTLAEVGIDHKLSSHAQKMAAIPEPQFKALIDTWRGEVSTAKARVTTDLLKIGSEADGRQTRRDLASALSNESVRLTGQRRYGCVYADPAWRRKAGIGDRAYENHYPTMTWDQIMALPVKDLMLPDAWLFLWLPRAHLMALHKVAMEVESDDGEMLINAWIELPLAWAIARAWGCDAYSTCFIWTKTDEEHENDIGTGLVVRDQDEVLCLFKRGNGLPKPAGHEKFGSNHRERSKPLGHSRKPQFYREMISTMVGTDSEGDPLPVLELFARANEQFPLPKNWDTWGNQALANEDQAA